MRRDFLPLANINEPETEMLKWYIILAITIAVTCAGLLFLANRIARSPFTAKLGQETSKRRKIFGAAAAVFLFTALALTLNLMNAVICLLHIVVLCLAGDFVFAIIQHFRKQPFRHDYAGMAALLLSLAALSAGWYLDHHVWTTNYTIETPKKIKDLRIVLFADSHIGTTFDTRGFAEHISEMQRQNPDIVLVAGDFVDDGTTRQQMIEACRALGSLQTTYGVYFAFGNHDKGYHDPAARGFTGEDLITEKKKNYVKGILRGIPLQSLNDLLQGLNIDKFSIILDHQPNDYNNQTDAEADLVLSGHTHGGQLFPLNKVGEWIGANDKTYGYEKRKQTNFIVTSGLSDWAIKFKTGTKSEFVVIDIKHNNSPSSQRAQTKFKHINKKTSHSGGFLLLADEEKFLSSVCNIHSLCYRLLAH